MTTTNKVANPGVLGLFAFGMIAFLLSMHNAEIIPLDSVIFAMGLLYGGAAQILAGILEYKRGNTFAATAFTSFGTLWVLIILIMTDLFGSGPASADSMAVLFAMWGIVAYVFAIGTLKTGPRSFQIAFFCVATLLIILAIVEVTGSDALKLFAGAFGMFCGALAVYMAGAELLNEIYEKKVLPL